MKKYTTDMLKLIALLFVTPILVMAYTTIEKTVATAPASQNQSKSVSARLTGESKSSTYITKKVQHNDYLVIRYNQPVNSRKSNERIFLKNNLAFSRFTLILL